jgi:predicted DNA-binding transcriptional regulator YafY
MNRTDRLYAIVELLRASPSRPTSARAIANHFEVSSRTIERDILALQEAGVPIYAEGGRTGGYLLDSLRTLPPVNFTPTEAAAIAIALGSPQATPLPHSARSALAKIMAAMSAEDADSARQLGQRLVRFDAPGSPFGRSQRVIEQAIADRTASSAAIVCGESRLSASSGKTASTWGQRANARRIPALRAAETPRLGCRR